MGTKPGHEPAIVIPCYNCGSSIIDVVNGCRNYTDKILVLNDGSTDDTLHSIQRCHVERLGWEQNRGKAAALLEGFHYWLEKDDWHVLITMDSDGQHDPEDIPKFLEHFSKTQADLIVGKRDFSDEDIPGLRRWANVFSSTLIRQISGCNLSDFQCGFRLHKRRMLEDILTYLTSTGYAMETEILIRAHRLGYKIEECAIHCIYTDDSNQRSSWKPFTDSWHITKAVLKALRTQKR